MANGAGNAPLLRGVAGVKGELQGNQKVSITFIVGFVIAQLSLFIAIMAPVIMGIAVKIINIAGNESATDIQGLILGSGAIAAVIGAPVFGALSDTTRSRYGRRRPWLLAGSLALFVCLWAIAVADAITVILIAWFFAQLSANACLAAFLATIADQIPPRLTARIASIVGITQNLAILFAAFLSRHFVDDIHLLFFVPGAICVFGMLLYSMVLRDPSTVDSALTATSSQSMLSDFWIDLKENPCFLFAFLSKSSVVLGLMLFVTFRFFWVIDNLELNPRQAAEVLFNGVFIYTGVLLLTAPFCAWLSDRYNLRKPLALFAITIFAMGFVFLTQVESVGHFYWIEALQGFAFGVYTSVDLTIVISILANSKTMARDLGVYNVAQSAPQSVAPFLGAVLIGGADKNYVLLYSVAAVVCVIGACLILPIRKVK